MTPQLVVNAYRVTKELQVPAGWMFEEEFIRLNSDDGRDRQWTLWAALTNKGPLPGRQSLLLLAVHDSKQVDEDCTNRKAQQRLLQYEVTESILNVGDRETLSFDLDMSALTPQEMLVVLEPNAKSTNLGRWSSLLIQFTRENTVGTEERRQLL